MKTKDEIKKLLTNDERLRDSDSKLIARFWTNAYEFLCLFAQSKLHNVEGLTRMRRKVQEENENLRGKLYNFRKHNLQNKMKAKLGYNIHMSCEVPKGHYEDDK
jgi:hypothetical protein